MTGANMRTTRASIQEKVARAGSGWDDNTQTWMHGYNGLPKAGSAASFNKGEGLGVWLRASAGGHVPWKEKEYHFRPEPEISARMKAAQDGDVDKLRDMLDKDTVARMPDKDKLGRTVLHAAAAAGHAEVVCMLAARCAGWPATTEKDENGIAGKDTEEDHRRAETCSAVKTASDRADLAESKAKEEATKRLLQTDQNMTAATIAEYFSDHNMGFAHKSAPESIFRACSPTLSKWAMTAEPVKSVGDRGFGSRLSRDFHVPSNAWNNYLNMRDRVGDAPMHLAAAEGHADVVDELLYRGAEVETRNLAGRTALHLACMNAHPQVIYVLCAAGANARSRDREGRRPVDMTRDEEVVQFLWALVSKEVAVKGGPTVCVVCIFGH